MKCPVCTTENLVMAERKGIEIDYCPRCRGVWLDRGELDKIIERSSEEQITPVEGPRGQPVQHQQPVNMHDSDYGKYQYKRKKSWLSELFD